MKYTNAAVQCLDLVDRAQSKDLKLKALEDFATEIERSAAAHCPVCGFTHKMPVRASEPAEGAPKEPRNEEEATLSARVTPFPGGKIVKGASGRIHECSICGKKGIWGPGWEWRYEIHRYDEKTGDPGWEDLIKTCSDECRVEDKARRKS